MNFNAFNFIRIAFNSSTNFNYTGSPSASQYDFKSVAEHEMMHIFGFGLDNHSFTRYTATGFFTGPNVVATTGFPVQMQAGTDPDHFAAGTRYNGQESVMTPAVTAGRVKRFSALDYAALRDIGWGSNGCQRGGAPLASRLACFSPPVFAPAALHSSLACSPVAAKRRTRLQSGSSNCSSRRTPASCKPSPRLSPASPPRRPQPRVILSLPSPR